MNNIVPFTLHSAPHPAAMAAAQLMMVNDLPLSDLLKAMKVFRAMIEEQGD